MHDQCCSTYCTPGQPKALSIALSMMYGLAPTLIMMLLAQLCFCHLVAAVS